MIRRTALKRSTQPIPRKRKGKPRRGPAGIDPARWRNPAYLQFLREKGKCVACATKRARDRYIASACDPCHGPVSGLGAKGEDAGCVPMCRTHHDLQHSIGWPAFEERFGFEREREAAVWWKAWQVHREFEV